MVDIKKTMLMLLFIISVFFAGCGDDSNIGNAEDDSMQVQQPDNQSTNQEIFSDDSSADEVVDSVIDEDEKAIDEDIELGELI